MTRSNSKEIWKKIDNAFHHIEIQNREMGQVQTDIAWIKSEMKSLKQWMKWMFGMSISIWIVVIGLILR